MLSPTSVLPKAVFPRTVEKTARMPRALLWLDRLSLITEGPNAAAMPSKVLSETTFPLIVPSPPALMPPPPLS
jgi:hypothetical protein